jgi:5S rRNA maturation endonuclease (ribonuclease M5)
MSDLVDLEVLVENCIERIDELLPLLGVDEFLTYDDRISFMCPIHGSDNPESIGLFTTGHTAIGNWRCWTGNCEEDVLEDGVRGKNFFGLVRGLLSVKEDKHVCYGEAVNWCKDFIGCDLIVNKEDVDFGDIKSFIKQCETLLRGRTKLENAMTRDEIRGKLNIPAQYFIGREYTFDVLDKYDVGFCDTRKSQMFNRVVVPVYDDEHENMVGCVGRTIKPKCAICGKNHYFDDNCPEDKYEKYLASKWINSKGFKSEATLYNLWYAKEHISECGVAVLVEGPADVWRLEEAGIHIGLGLFGDSLGDQQLIALDETGAMSLLILTDEDEAGLRARKKIETKCKRSYNCIFLDLPKEDVGDMTVNQIQRLILPVLEKVSWNNKS